MSLRPVLGEVDKVVVEVVTKQILGQLIRFVLSKPFQVYKTLHLSIIVSYVIKTLDNKQHPFW